MTIQLPRINNAHIIIEVLSQWMHENKSIVARWEDDNGHGLDILITIPATLGQTYNHQSNNIVIGIIGYGAYSFPIKNNELHSSYISDKLNLRNDDTTIRLTEFINALLHTIYAIRNG